MDWPGGNWQNIATLAATIAVAYVFVLWISIIAWTYRDIRDRSRDAAFQIVAVLLVLVFNIAGWFIYMLLRPSETLAQAYARSLEEEALLQELEEQGICPSCKRYVIADFVICPYCRTQLKEPCANCSRPLSFNWVACPSCATPKTKVAASSQKEMKPVSQTGEARESAERQRAASP
ncbi:MAG: zinc ribbon domain-containing protein [Dehalococcoidia bacterium]|nr:zinc ribbon domain-containing protein [Dehalococcoidia bacterium]